MEYFRIDNAYGKVYEYDEKSNSYVFYSSFYALGIDKKMTNEKKLRIINNNFMNNYSDPDLPSFLGGAE